MRFVAWFLLLANFVVSAAVAQSGFIQSPGVARGNWGGNLYQKKLIQFDDIPSIRTVAGTDSSFQNAIGMMQSNPFVGTVFDSYDNTVTNQINATAWTTTALTLSSFSSDVATLKTIKWGKMTDNFLRITSQPNGAPSNVDWFDNTAWTTILANMTVVAQIAAVDKTHVKGVFLDTENYGFTTWQYSTQSLVGSKTFAQYGAQVRLRGQQFMSNLQAVYPNIALMWSFGLGKIGYPLSDVADLSTAQYGMLGFFLDGIVDVAGSQTHLIDGNEVYEQTYLESYYGDYYYKKFQLPVTNSEIPSAYMAKVTMAVSTWMDDPDGSFSKTAPWTGNFYKPDAWEHSLNNALAVTDKYVWVFNTTTNWWYRVQSGSLYPPPTAYLTATRNAYNNCVHRQNRIGP